MEDETASFSAYFAQLPERTMKTTPPVSVDAKRAAQEVVIKLHDEALQLLSQIARAEGVTGSTEHMRSVALQISLDRFSRFCQERGSEIAGELHLSAGPIKDRALCLFSDTLTELAGLERDLHCSETILLETAILRTASATGIDLPRSSLN